MRNGRLLPDGSPDDVIRGTPRDPSRFADADSPRRDHPGGRHGLTCGASLVALAVLALSGCGENTDDNAVRRVVDRLPGRRSPPATARRPAR